MTEVIVRHLVAMSPGGDVTPSSGVNNKGRGTGGEHWLLTYNENDERLVVHRLVAALLSGTWHCVVRAHLLGLMTWPHRACRVGTCRARCGQWTGVLRGGSWRGVEGKLITYVLHVSRVHPHLYITMATGTSQLQYHG